MEQLSKEEILYNELGGFTRSMLSDEDIYKAMDIYAKQTAVGLIQFMYASCAETIPNTRPAKWNIDLNTEVTFEQLYELYTQSLNK